MLDSLVVQALGNTYAASSKGPQDSAIRQWIRFCRELGTASLRAGWHTVSDNIEITIHDEWMLCKFACYLVHGGCMPSTASSYVSHVRQWHQIHTGVKIGISHSSDPRQGTRFSKVIRGLKSLTGYRIGRKKAILLHQAADLIQLYTRRL